MTASLVSRDSWADLIPPDDLPERDVYADLGDGAPPSEARRAAEKLFGRFVVDQKPVPTQVASEAPIPTAPELVAPVRVLPDLLAVAREEERRAGEAPKRKRAAKGAGTTKPRKKSEQARTQVGVRVIDPPAQPSGMLNGHAEAALALSRSRSRHCIEAPAWTAVEGTSAAEGVLGSPRRITSTYVIARHGAGDDLGPASRSDHAGPLSRPPSSRTGIRRD